MLLLTRLGIKGEDDTYVPCAISNNPYAKPTRLQVNIHELIKGSVHMRDSNLHR
jgi:hypothetical protein